MQMCTHKIAEICASIFDDSADPRFDQLQTTERQEQLAELDEWPLAQSGLKMPWFEAPRKSHDSFGFAN